MENTKSLPLVITHYKKEIDGQEREWHSFEVQFVIDGDPYSVALNPKDANSKKMLINQATKRGVVIEGK